MRLLKLLAVTASVIVVTTTESAAQVEGFSADPREERSNAELVFEVTSPRTVEGFLDGGEVRFVATQTQQVVTIRIDLGSAWIDHEFDYARGTGFSRASLPGDEAATALSTVERASLEELFDELRSAGAELPEEGRIRDALFSMAGFLMAHPEGVVIDVDTRGQETPVTWTSICGEIGTLHEAVWDVDDNPDPFMEDHLVEECYTGVCAGRCGSGCSGLELPPGEVQRYTQDCFNHDVCCEETGGGFSCFTPFGDCGDEWAAAFDDFHLATDCARIAGDWVMELEGTTCLDGSCSAVGGTGLGYDYQEFAVAAVWGFWGGFENSDGRWSRTFGIRDGEGALDGDWRLATYMDEGCDFRFAGMATGTFGGSNQCGEKEMDLDGSWPWYDPVSCSPIGDGTFEGSMAGAEVAGFARVVEAPVSAVRGRPALMAAPRQP